MSRCRITNVTAVTVDPALGVIPGCDILIEGETLVEIRPGIVADDAETIDGRGMIAMPGLVNAHIHAWETMMRGAGARWVNEEYFTVFLGMVAEHVTPDEIHDAVPFGALGQIDAGTTTMFEWCHHAATPDHSDMVISALETSGIRGVFGHGTPKPNSRPGQRHFSELPHPAEDIRRLRKGRFAANDDGLLSMAMCILGPDYAGIEVNRHDFALARECDLMTSAHVWGGNQRKTPGGYRTIVEEGLMDPRHNAVHANFFEDEEVRLLIDHGASVTATPVAEIGVPRAPQISQVIRAGGRPSIAVDSEIDVSGSMFDAMRAASQLQAAFDSMAAHDPEGSKESTGRPDIDSIVTAHDVTCTPDDVLAWATINNAHALGLQDRTGSLTPGKKADLVLLRGGDLNLFPATDPVDVITSRAHPGNVDTVMIAGRIMKQGGRLLAEGIDLDALKQRLSASRSRMFRVAAELGRPLD